MQGTRHQAGSHSYPWAGQCAWRWDKRGRRQSGIPSGLLSCRAEAHQATCACHLLGSHSGNCAMQPTTLATAFVDEFNYLVDAACLSCGIVSLYTLLCVRQEYHCAAPELCSSYAETTLSWSAWQQGMPFFQVAVCNQWYTSKRFPAQD